MEAFSNLTIIAELAIAYAGFAGVFVVLRHEAKGIWTQLEKVRLLSLLTLSIPVAFFSLLPAGLAPLMPEAQQVWRVSSAIAGSVFLALGAWSFPTFTRVSNAIPSLANDPLATVTARVMLLLFLISVALYASIVFGFTTKHF